MKIEKTIKLLNDPKATSDFLNESLSMSKATWTKLYDKIDLLTNLSNMDEICQNDFMSTYPLRKPDSDAISDLIDLLDKYGCRIKIIPND